jgi:hypothetical protein
MILDIQEHPRVAQRTAVAGDRAVVDVKSLRGKSGAVRHFVLGLVSSVPR